MPAQGEGLKGLLGLNKGNAGGRGCGEWQPQWRAGSGPEGTYEARDAALGSEAKPEDAAVALTLL